MLVGFARTNAFEAMFRVMMDDDVDIELLMLGAQKVFIRICCTPSSSAEYPLQPKKQKERKKLQASLSYIPCAY